MNGSFQQSKPSHSFMQAVIDKQCSSCD